MSSRGVLNWPSKVNFPHLSLQVLPVLGTCLLLFQSWVKMRSTAHFVGSMHEVKSVYVCPKCGKHLVSRATMEMHQSSCGSQDYPHNCATCGKGYHTKQALLQHLKTHQPPASVEEHTCPDCKQVFNLVKTMREHRAMHRGPFPCPVEDWPATFSLPKHHNHHLREKHGFNSRRN